MDSAGPHRSRSPRGSNNHCDAESFALDLLRQDRSLAKEDILKLFDLLPKESHSGARDADKPGDSFTTGLYARVKVSLRRNCRLFPNSTKVITRFVLQVHPDQALPKRACPIELHIADLGWVGWGHQWWVSLHMFASATKTKQFDLNLRMFTKPFQFLRGFSFSEHVRCGFTRAVSSQLGWEFQLCRGRFASSGSVLDTCHGLAFVSC